MSLKSHARVIQVSLRGGIKNCFFFTFGWLDGWTDLRGNLFKNTLRKRCAHKAHLCIELFSSSPDYNSNFKRAAGPEYTLRGYDSR